jgi:kinesin family protein 2/24
MYGMTGSGKTYSTNLMFRAAPEELFSASNSGSSDSSTGSISLIAYELIGKNCFDLLCAEKPQVHLRVGEDGATHVQGSTRCQANCWEELQAKLDEASSCRETAATGTNFTSSRSHAVYEISTPAGGTFTIIDLAGNEGNIETAYHSKEQMRQAAEINLSLMALRKCLAARACGKKHVPYRESILTRVLRDSFTSEAAVTAVLCCVSPACSHQEHTLATLQTAVHLTGQSRPIVPLEEEVKEKGVMKGGPKVWDAEELARWAAELHLGSNTKCADGAAGEEKARGGSVALVLPEGMTGQMIMKLPVARLAPLCGGDLGAAKQLFEALRVSSKKAAEKDRQLRREMKAGPRPASSMEFSKHAPSLPVAVSKIN